MKEKSSMDKKTSSCLMDWKQKKTREKIPPLKSHIPLEERGKIRGKGHHPKGGEQRRGKGGVVTLPANRTEREDTCPWKGTRRT